MTLIMTTSLAEQESDEIKPSGEFVLQVTGGAGTVIVDVFARVDGDGDWSPVTSWTLANGAFKRLARLPRVKVKVRNNAALAAITVRSS